MKRLILLFILFPALAYAGTAGIIYTDTDCSQAKYLVPGVLCQNDVTGKYYCGVGATGLQDPITSGDGAPTTGNCDAAGELGLIYIDTTNHRFYWCEGTGGWKYAGGT
jgi:hypothetical protein